MATVVTPVLDEQGLDRLLTWGSQGVRPLRPAAFRFTVDTPDGPVTRCVVAAEDGVAVTGSLPYPPNAVVELDQGCLIRIVLGELGGALAFSSGLLRIDGDVALAMGWIHQLGQAAP